jgi:cytoskeletal protein RodZ
MNERKTLQELLKELIAAKGFSVDKLATLSNIPSRFINLIVEGKYKQLPSKPYIRGYLIKIAAILEVDPEMLLDSYNSSVGLPSSGNTDRLPVNRFELKPINRGWIIATAIIVILGGIIIFRFNDIVGTPEIYVNIPTTTDSQTIQVSGKVRPGDSLTLNSQTIYPMTDGTFQTSVLLTPGLNTLQFSVKRFLGRETDLVKQINYITSATSGTQIPTSTQTQ